MAVRIHKIKNNRNKSRNFFNNFFASNICTSFTSTLNGKQFKTVSGHQVTCPFLSNHCKSVCVRVCVSDSGSSNTRSSSVCRTAGRLGTTSSLVSLCTSSSIIPSPASFLPPRRARSKRKLPAVDPRWREEISVAACFLCFLLLSVPTQAFPLFASRKCPSTTLSFVPH